MVDFGIAHISNMAINKYFVSTEPPIKNLGTVYISDMITTKYVTSNETPGMRFNIGTVDWIARLNPARRVVDPNIGQIWPRGMVGEYVGEIGSIVFHNFTEYPPEANPVLGQLWPRGDFIPEVDS